MPIPSIGRTLGGLACAVALAVVPMGAAHAAGSTPSVTTIQEGVGAGGVRLGMTKTQVVAQWGSPKSCSTTSSREVCRFTSADGLANPLVILSSSPRRVTMVSISVDTIGWTTTRGVHVGSTASPSLTGHPAAEFESAYVGLIDTSRSSYYSKVVPGVDALGRASTTRFTLGWYAEYTPGQFFGVTGITVSVP